MRSIASINIAFFMMMVIELRCISRQAHFFYSSPCVIRASRSEQLIAPPELDASLAAFSCTDMKLSTCSSLCRISLQKPGADCRRSRTGASFLKLGCRCARAVSVCHFAELRLADPLQDFRPSPNTYDLVWVQWAIGHVTDEDLVPLLARLKACLTPAGVIILKENVLTGNGGNSTLVDLGGCSVRRSNSHFKALFGRGGCRVVKEDAQKQLPSDLCRVKMWALR